MNEKNNNIDELEKITKKYKKLRNTVIIILLIILLIFVLKTGRELIILYKVSKNNINANLGNNYKITRISNDGTQKREEFFKDGMYKMVSLHNETSLITNYYINGNWLYIIENKENGYKNYFERTQEVNGLKIADGVNMSNYFLPSYDWKFNLPRMIVYILSNDIKIKTIDYEGEKCYKITQDTSYMIVSKDDFFAVEDNGYKMKIEFDVVTDDDMKLLDKNEYMKESANNN